MIGSWIRFDGNVRRTRIRVMMPAASTASRDRGHDGDDVGFLERGLLAFEEADVLLVDVDVDEAAELPALVDEPLLEPGELALEVGDHVVYRVAGGSHLGIALGGLAEWRRDSDRRHVASPFQLVCDFRFASAWSNADSDGLIATCADSFSYRASGVLSPLPVMQITMDSLRGMTPLSMSFLVVATVTPPAVSVKMPSVRASSSIPSMIS